ncbi:MAG: copper resistance protein CopD [Chloroflexi bacterium]|nr:MAG: copper resistance protein CopD [Chloroflexota bacterium]
MGRRFRDIGWICIGLLLVSGVMNLWYRGVRWESLTSSQFWHSSWGQILAVKLAIVLIMLLNSAWHDFVLGPRATQLMEAQANPGANPAEVQRLRRQTTLLARLNLLSGLVVIALAVMLVRGLP